MKKPALKSCALLLLALLWLAPASARACAACYGQSDSPLAAGMNWAILALLGVIVSVLGGVAGFFIFLARRAAVPPGRHAAIRPLGQRLSFGVVGRGQAAAPFFDRTCRPGTGMPHARPSCLPDNSEPAGRAAWKGRA